MADKCKVISANFSIPWDKVFNSRDFWNRNFYFVRKKERKGEACTLSSEGKVRISEKRETFLMNCQFVPDVIFVCRDLQLCVMWCAAGWRIIKGGVGLTGRRILLYSSWPKNHTNQPVQSHMNKLTVHPWDTLKPERTLFFKLQKQWLHQSVGSFSVLANVDSGGEEAEYPASQFPLKSLSLPFFFFLFPSLFLNQNLEVIYEVGMAFLLSRSGYLSRAQRGGTPVWRPTPPIKGIASEWSWGSQRWNQLWFDV